MPLPYRAIVLAFMLIPLAAVAAPAKPAAPALRALDINNSAALKLAALERELQDIALAPVFTAEALTSPTRLAQGRATLARLRSLTVQRSEVARSHAAEIAALRAASPAALAGVDSYLIASQRVHEELHAARTEVADRADEVLMWAAAQGNSIRAEGKRIRMTPQQQQRYNALFAPLEKAMARHEKAVDAEDTQRVAPDDQREANRARLAANERPGLSERPLRRELPFDRVRVAHRHERLPVAVRAHHRPRAALGRQLRDMRHGGGPNRFAVERTREGVSEGDEPRHLLRAGECRQQ